MRVDLGEIFTSMTFTIKKHFEIDNSYVKFDNVLHTEK